MDRELIKYLALLLGLFLVLGYFRYSINKSEQAIEACGEVVLGAIVSIRQPLNKLPVVSYKFRVGEETFKSTESIGGQGKFDYVNRDKAIKVKYECGNPKNSILVFPNE